MSTSNVTPISPKAERERRVKEFLDEGLEYHRIHQKVVGLALGGIALANILLVIILFK